MPDVESAVLRGRRNTGLAVGWRCVALSGNSLGGKAMHVVEMLKTHPEPPRETAELIDHLTSLLDCAATCTLCADACLGEENVKEMVRCIKLNLQCADICAFTAKTVAHPTPPDQEVMKSQLRACGAACRACAAECQKHGKMHDHCRVCAEACQECAKMCEQMSR
jgi:hypothetical protein